MSLRSPTVNESKQFPGHAFASVVIPAHAGIQVCSRRFSLDTRFRGYDRPQLLPRQLLSFRARIFEEGTKDTKVGIIFTFKLRALPITIGKESESEIFLAKAQSRQVTRRGVSSRGEYEGSKKDFSRSLP